MNAPDLSDVDPHRLAGLLSNMNGDEGFWEVDELGAVLEHQLAAPIRLGDEPWDDQSSSDRTLTVDHHPAANTFGQLFQQFCPPVELLVQTKRFAKAIRYHPDRPLPEPVANVLYLLSITAALVRCGQRITTLTDESLRRGIRWALDQAWLDPASRKLLEDGLGHLGLSEG